MDFTCCSHALERMEERNLFPTVIEDVLMHGEYYRLERVSDGSKIHDSIDVYVKRETAKVVPGKRIGERILEILPEREKQYKSIIVLIDREREIKTAYVVNDKRLDDFFNRYMK